MKIDKKDFARAGVDIDVTPGDMLKALRELQGLTQEELSELTGISQPNVSAMESGAKQIGRERALVLAIALKVHPSVILFPDFDMKKVA